ncbi:MAG: DUF262 domain-containing protein [Eubacteriales bacterium]|jgi:hypothetical protein
MSIELDCSDIIEIFKTHLKIDNSVKSIAHTFLNERYASRIDYAPYFQRKYVWDSEKATYFIESIMLGTEIPPIVLFDDGTKNEVIDGRQRYETIKRFLDNEFTLDNKGLKSLTDFSGLNFSKLPEDIIAEFKNTKIRILQFSIVNEPSLTPDQEDKVKKEIFKRYNSGIIALKQQEIDRAAYINDPFVRKFKEKLESDKLLLNKCQLTLMPKRKQNINERDKVNYILSRARNVLSMRFIPIQSYAAASSKSDVIRNYMLLKVEKEPVEYALDLFIQVINKLFKVRSEFVNSNSPISDNNLFFEVLFWGLSVIFETSTEQFIALDVCKIVKDIIQCSSLSYFWNNISVERKDFNMVFFATGSHYYKSILNRYTFIANYLSAETKVDFSLKLKNKNEFDEIMSQTPVVEQFKKFKLSKTDPVSATVYDILTDVKTSNFNIRPDYQRSEVPNYIQKASYLMESIMLGIRIPPIFIFRCNNNVSEVIDGQQRLLSILGFLRESYKDKNGKEQLSDKHGFKLSGLRFLKELNGKDIEGVEKIDSDYKDRILDFQIDIVEINQSQNPDFNPIDLFLRLNSKPFPIEPNTFEMWNAYVTREYVETIKAYAKEYSGKLFKPLDTRMKNEELITMLAYLAYIKRKEKIKPGEYLNIFVRNQRINARFSTKGNITTKLGEISSTNDPVFGDALRDVKSFIEKLQILCGNDFQDFNKMLGHSRKNAQSRTNQNFYLLWIAVSHIEPTRLKKNKTQIFNTIREMFLFSQEINDDKFDVKNFIHDLESI